MPPQLMELYNLYKQELETRSSKENQFVEDLNNEIIRVSLNSMFVPDKYLSFVRHLPWFPWGPDPKPTLAANLEAACTYRP